MRPEARIEGVAVSAYRIPTDAPESDGTLEWDSTTMVVVEIQGGGAVGLGYGYADRATAVLIEDALAGVLEGRDALGIPGAWEAMVARVRNLGRPGIAAMAVSCCDAALWDLKGKLLGVSIADLLGRRRDSVELYGSGGFCSYDDARLEAQLGGWVAEGLSAVKMKVGREPERDVERVRLARRAVGKAGLFVDANGAWDRKLALRMAEIFAGDGVSWFEEPVSSDDLEGLRLLRDRASMEITAGEYGYGPGYFRRMCAAGAVDVLQADATRCMGITGYMLADAVADAFELPLSSHTAPALHLPACCASLRTRHMEWFHDHVRIEAMLFDGAPVPSKGRIAPDLTRPGVGLELRRADAEEFRI